MHSQSFHFFIIIIYYERFAFGKQTTVIYWYPIYYFRSLKIGSKAVVCQEALLVGEITIEDGTVVHPKASIIAEGGPIIIGQNNIIEEQVVIKTSYVA